MYPDDGRDAETLIRNADAAMYHAKELGRANYQFFTEQMNQAASRRLKLESDLRRAHQPRRAARALPADRRGGERRASPRTRRWCAGSTPSAAWCIPAEFIQLAEETGLILKIGEWVLREACRWTTFIGARSHDGGDLQIAVNLSARQFNDPQLPQHRGAGAAARPACRRACSSSRSPSRPRCSRPTPRCAPCSA